MARVPSLRLHKPSGRAVVTIQGKDFYLGPYLDADGGRNADAQRQYERLIAEYFAGGRSATFGRKAEELTLSQLILAFLKAVKARHGVGPASDYHRYKPVLRVVRKLYGSSPAGEFRAVQ